MEYRPLSPLSSFLLIGTALLLYVISYPIFGNIRIDFVALLILYLGIYRDIPHPLALAFSAGILQDLISLAPLGRHALGLVLVSGILHSMRDQLRLISVIRQIPAVFALLLFLKLQYSWIAALNFGTLPTLGALGSSIITILIWIPMVMVLQRVELRSVAS